MNHAGVGVLAVQRRRKRRLAQRGWLERALDRSCALALWII
jgi:hypothetical protein